MSKSSLLTCLVLLFVVAIALGQAELSKPFPILPLEKYDDPPAPFPLLGIRVSPGMLSQEGLFTSHQVNVDANGMNILGDAANEPSIAVDPTNRSRMVIGWRQFNSVTSNFREAGWGYTTNGGVTWTFPGVLENNIFRSDPVLNSDDTGQIFYLSLLVETVFCDMWRSIKAGQSFMRLGPATGGDKEWFTIDNTNSTGHGFQYQFFGAKVGEAQFSRSTDGGFTWMDPISVPNTPIIGTLDVDTNGNLFIGGVNASTFQFWCIRSTDAKKGAVTPSFDQSTPVDLGGALGGGDLINPSGLTGQLFLAVDRSGTNANNNIYLLASVIPTGLNSGTDVMFVRSTDGGKTFSVPKRINDDPINPSKWHWFGTFAVAPSGRIDSVWLDTRNAANNTDSQLFYSYSTDSGVTWSPNVAVSNPFNPFLGYPNQNKMGDYITIVSDSTGGDVAYAATFNLEEDIYYVRVAPGIAPTPSPTPTATATVAPSPTATATPTPTPMPVAQAINLSTRMRVQTGDNVGIGGFIITGSVPKRVTVRGIGPSLAPVGVPNPLADPVLELHGPPGFTTIVNDNWRDAQINCEFSDLAPTDNLEAAICDRFLDPGSYTAVVRGKNNSSGVALVEVYDVDAAAASKLANISTRALVNTGNDIVIAGFILGNNSGNDSVILRGIGPSLMQFGITNALANPTLELRDSNGAVIRENNNWQDDPAQAAIIAAAGLAPTNSLESGIAATLAPGQYTALLAGLNSGTGLGLVEVYDLGAP